MGKMERMAGEGAPFFLFQSCALSQNHSGKEASKNSPKGGARESMGSKRDDLMRRLLQFSNLAWKISLEREGTKLFLEKGPLSPLIPSEAKNLCSNGVNDL
jgi:hypothetical protein